MDQGIAPVCRRDADATATGVGRRQGWASSGGSLVAHRHSVLFFVLLLSFSLFYSFPFTRLRLLLFPLSLKAAINALRRRYDALRRNSYEGGVEGVGGPGILLFVFIFVFVFFVVVLFDTVRFRCRCFSSSRLAVSSLLYPTGHYVEGLLLPRDRTKRDTSLYTHTHPAVSLARRGAILRLDLILRDHYVGRHRQVLRYVLVLA